jgi:hypothetical protein
MRLWSSGGGSTGREKRQGQQEMSLVAERVEGDLVPLADVTHDDAASRDESR